MRCPYCGGLNQERAAFCVTCGRDLRRPNVQPQQPGSPANPSNQPAYRGPNQPAQPSRAANTPVQTGAPTSRRQPTTTGPAQLLYSAPEPPGPFPPRTIAQFENLMAPGCQAYTVVEDQVENGKKILSIAYARCGNWQQAATLLKALQEHREDKYATIVIRGVFSQQPNAYGFTNGQMQFDRGVRLGDQTCNRYVVETGNGYASDSVRFVLNE